MLRVLELMGGGKLHESSGRFKCFDLNDSRRVHIKYSKLHQRGNYFWYGVRSAIFERLTDLKSTHVVFILGDSGFVVVPLDTINEYLKTTKVSRNPDGSIRHYHVLISNDPEPELYWSSDTPRFQLADVFETFG